jgi:hypothetical protein
VVRALARRFPVNRMSAEELAQRINKAISEHTANGGNPVDLLPSWLVDSLRGSASRSGASSAPQTYSKAASKKEQQQQAAAAPASAAPSGKAKGGKPPSPAPAGAGAPQSKAVPSKKSSSNPASEVTPSGPSQEKGVALHPLDDSVDRLQRNAVKNYREKVRDLMTHDGEIRPGSSKRELALAFNAMIRVVRAAQNLSDRKVPKKYIPAKPVLKNKELYSDPSKIIAMPGGDLAVSEADFGALSGEGLKPEASSSSSAGPKPDLGSVAVNYFEDE